jgi:soluble lytic murein transglycosylase-like protein
VILLGVLALSGGPRPGELAAPPPGGAAGAFQARVAERIQWLNPALSPYEVARIGQAAERYAAQYGLEVDLVLGILEVESGARIAARSPKGAMGLMQVMPHMAAALDLAGNHTTIESNIEAGCLILAHNIRRLGEEDGISAYFWGSDIRGVSYLNRVRAARAIYRSLRGS